MNTPPQITLQECYPQEHLTFQKLFPHLTDLLLLNNIFRVTEEKWEDNIQRLLKKNSVVRYLMIGEAAPTIDQDALTQQVSYFYNTNSGSWCNAINRVFLNHAEISSSIEKRLDLLADNGFLLVDTMPFAADYSKNNKRNSPHYAKLVSQCATSFMLKKLSDPRISWHQDIKVCFGVRRNALWLMQGLNDNLTIGNTNISLSESQIGTNATHYPDTKIIKNVFDII